MGLLISELDTYEVERIMKFVKLQEEKGTLLDKLIELKNIYDSESRDYIKWDRVPEIFHFDLKFFLIDFYKRDRLKMIFSNDSIPKFMFDEWYKNLMDITRKKYSIEFKKKKYPWP